MAKKTVKRPTAKRDLVQRRAGSAYAKRTTKGEFREMDDVGRSQKTDAAAALVALPPRVTTPEVST